MLKQSGCGKRIIGNGRSDTGGGISTSVEGNRQRRWRKRGPEINPNSAGGCMHKCTYRSNTITRIRKRMATPKERGIYSRTWGGGRSN